MFAALLLTISILALGQFGAFYWRALVACEAARPISQGVLDAVSVDATTLRGADYHSLAELHSLTPDLSFKSCSLGLVPAYFKVMHMIATLATGRSQGVANWAEGERVLCARYIAVQIDRRLQSNLELAASIRSS